jgi:uncharacterized protein
MSREQNNGHVDAMGIELCLSCGLCCQGVIFNRAGLKPDEIGLAKDNGLDYFPSGEEEFAFRLPCRLYQDDKCSIYLIRPEACRRYRCDLLKRLTNKAISLEESKIIVSQIKSLMDSINKQMDNIEPSADFNQRIIKFLDLQSRNSLTSKDSSAFLRDIGHFFVFLQKNIERRAI